MSKIPKLLSEELAANWLGMNTWQVASLRRAGVIEAVGRDCSRVFYFARDVKDLAVSFLQAGLLMTTQEAAHAVGLGGTELFELAQQHKISMANCSGSRCFSEENIYKLSKIASLPFRIEPVEIEAREKYRDNARRLVFIAKAQGRLVPMPCELCASSEVEAHHKDYTRPLDVRWLCSGCHKAVHAGKAMLA